MKLLEGKVALITGASRGIGAATAFLFGQHGATVVVNYAINKEAANQVVSQIVSAGGKALAIKADVTNQEQVSAMIAKTNSDLGPIDIMVLNASISFPVLPFVKFQWEDFERKLTDEMKATFFCCQEVVPTMLKRKTGCIVAVSSGLSRQPGIGFCAHSSAKSALDAFVKSLALELGPEGIRVNLIAPGLTLTDATSFLPEEAKKASANHTPLGRNAHPEDIAGAILIVSSDHAKFITGTYLPVSGGTQMI